MRKHIIGLVLATALAACGKGKDQTAAADSLNRDLQLAPAESTAAINDQPAATPPASEPAAPAPAKPKPKPAATTPKPVAPAPKSGTLASGTEVHATANDSLHSRHNKVGETFRATVANDVSDDKGFVVIPAGSTVTFTVAALEPAKNKGDADGKLRLTATSVEIDGREYAIGGSATQATVEHKLLGQGVTAGGAARVGGGAAAGAIAGKVIGGKTGAIIGGVVGGAGGAVVANKTADRDVVVRAGMAVTFTLSSDFTITRS
jgi:hypothetical protein